MLKNVLFDYFFIFISNFKTVFKLKTHPVHVYPVFSPDTPGASGGPSSFGRGASREGGASGEGGGASRFSSSFGGRTGQVQSRFLALLRG